ncbi:hypothetical protein GXW84_33830 [Rhodococcus sp. IEGM 248]|nr:hypothetical protein [Rhodococcus sp. IEGM 248]
MFTIASSFAHRVMSAGCRQRARRVSLRRQGTITAASPPAAGRDEGVTTP